MLYLVCILNILERSRIRFLRRFRSDLARSLHYLKNVLGPTYNVLRTGSRTAAFGVDFPWKELGQARALRRQMKAELGGIGGIVVAGRSSYRRLLMSSLFCQLVTLIFWEHFDSFVRKRLKRQKDKQIKYLTAYGILKIFIK